MTTKFISASEFFEKIGQKPLSLGRLLRALRISNEKTQVEMAIRLGISKQELCDIEKERKLVSIERAAFFAKKLKHSETIFVMYAIDDQLRRSGIKLRVKLEDAA
jgi:DNA-binding XRE family transcriptional regulator